MKKQTGGTHAIIGERISLHGFTESDIEFLFDLNNNPSVNKYLSYSSMTREKCQYYINLWIETYKDDILNVHKINLNDSGISIGLIFLVKRDNGIYELGYRLSPDFWHKGFAFEAASLLLDKFFRLYDDSVIAETHPDNQKSIGFLNKLGFREILVNDISQGRRFCLKKDDFSN